MQFLPALADYLADRGIQQVDKELTVFHVAGAAGLDHESLRSKQLLGFLDVFL